MGFGHLHAVIAEDLEAEFPAILAAVECRSAPIPVGGMRKLRRQKKILGASLVIVITALIALSLVVLKPHEDPLAKLNAALDYTWYHSEALDLRFPYPQAALMVDTTKEKEGRLPLHSRDRKQEVLITRTRLPSHNNVRVGRQLESEKLASEGDQANYLGPVNESNWSNWYVISGRKSNGDEFYYRRWYTDKDVVSIEFEYSPEKIGLYNDAIGAMTLDGRFQISN